MVNIMNSNKRPNILFILSDDHGYWALGKGCGGLDTLRTPNLDRIASEGIKLENCFCASPVCSPARASIMTGTIPSSHGIQDWLLGGSVDLDRCPYLKDKPEYKNEGKAIRYLDGKTCFTDLLAGVGYDVALSGKWHMGDSLNPQHGYSRWYTIGRGGCHYMKPDIVEDGKVVYEDRYVTDLITEKALTFLDELASDPERPFMLDVRYILRKSSTPTQITTLMSCPMSKRMSGTILRLWYITVKSAVNCWQATIRRSRLWISASVSCSTVWMNSESPTTRWSFSPATTA